MNTIRTIAGRILMARHPGTCGGCGREAGTGHDSNCPYR